MAARKPPAKPKSTKRRAATRPKEVEIKVDRALVNAWKKVLAVLEASNLEGLRAWDRKYEAVGEILAHDPPLYLAGGAATAGDFFAKYLRGEDERTILRNVRVAQYASPDEEARYGTSKIDAAIDYLEAKHGKPVNGRIPVDFAKLRVATTRGSVDFASASVVEVRAAARLAARGANGKKPAKRNPIVLALTKRLPKRAKDVTVHYANGRISLGGIPVAAFAEVLRALAAIELPASR
ncbi:MAG TPA: hypothetical protein VHB21_06385 [Minicystis sp.]|nr:hypothetical protein [Minicystis sp.]